MSPHNANQFSEFIPAYSPIAASRWLRRLWGPDSAALVRIVERMPVGIAIVSGPDHIHVFANPAYRKALGFHDQPILGRPARDLCRSGAAEPIRLLDQALATGEIAHIGEHETPADSLGGPIWWDGTAIPCRADDGTVEAIVVITRDVTEAVTGRHQLEQRAREAERRAEEVEEAHRTLDALLKHIPEGIIIVDAGDARIRYLSDYCQVVTGRSREELTSRPVGHHSQAWALYHPDGETPAAGPELPMVRVLRTGETVTNEEWVLGRADGTRVPILCNAGPIVDRRDNIVGCILAWRDITTIKRIDEALRRNERRLRLALDAAKLGEFDYDLRTGRMERSPFVDRLFGFAPGETGAGIAAFRSRIPADDLAMVDRSIEAAAGSGALALEHRIVWPDGSVRWVTTVGEVVRGKDGGAERVVGVTSDITGRKTLETALRRREADYRAMFDLAGVGKAKIDIYTGRFLRVNRKMCEIAGYSETELLEMTDRDLTLPDDRPAAGLSFRRLIDGRAPGISLEKRYRRKDGRTVWGMVTATLVHDETGPPRHIIAIVEDITARKQAEEALRASEEQYRAMAETVPVVLFTTRPGGWCDYNNARIHAVSGLPPGAVDGFGWLQLAHPDDREAVDNRWREAAETGAPFESRHRLRTVDGSYRWFVTRSRPIRDERGGIAKWFGTIADIDDLVMSEQALQATLSQKDMLLREVNHRIKNNLHLVNLLLMMQRDAITDPTARQQFLEATNRVLAIAQVHERLYRGPLAGAVVEIGGYLEGLCDDLARTFSGEARSQAVVVDAEEAEMPVDTVVPLGLIVNELVTNAFKYAFPDNRSGAVSVTFQADPANGRRLMVADDGVGLPAGFNPATSRGFGMQVVGALVDDLGARLEVDSGGSGARFTVVLPAG